MYLPVQFYALMADKLRNVRKTGPTVNPAFAFKTLIYLMLMG